MNLVVPWAELISLIAPHAPAPGAKGGRPSFVVETMLRIHFLQQWFNLPDEHGKIVQRKQLKREQQAPFFANLPTCLISLEACWSAHHWARKLLSLGHTVPANRRDLKAWQTGSVNAWHFGMEAHIGVDADSGLVHTVVGTAANVNDVTQAHALAHAEETDVFTDSGFPGVGKREGAQNINVHWHVAMRPGKRKALDKSTPMGAILDKLEHTKARIRAKVEQPFRVNKRQFGRVKVRYRGLAKNTAQLHALFALSNLWMVRHTLLQGMQGLVPALVGSMVLARNASPRSWR